MSLGWGYVPLVPPQQHPTAAAAAGDADNIEVIQLVTNRASAPSLGDFLAELYNSEVLSDITICSEDGQAIKCHRLVLIRWSAVLRRMLCGDMREARAASITLHGVEGDVLAAFMRFLYTCHCSIAPDKLVGLAAMADQYDVPLLQQLCMDAIRMHATNHRCCCLFYKAAKEVQQQEIQELAWQALSSNLHSLVAQHDVFVQLEFEDVLRLFNRQQQQQDEAQDGGGGTGAAGAQQQALQPAAGAAGAGDRPQGAAPLARAWARHNEAAAAAGAGAAAAAAAAGGGGGGADDSLDRLLRLALSEPQAALAAAAATAVRAAEPGQWPAYTMGFDDVPAEPHRGLDPPASNQDIAEAYQQVGRPQQQQQWQQQQQQPRRPEYALFLACMAWLHHSPQRQQHKQALYECFDFGAMRDSELSQMRRNPHVQGDPDLKELLLDAFEARCRDHAQQPVYHMAPHTPSIGWGLPSGGNGWGTAPGAL